MKRYRIRKNGRLWELWHVHNEPWANVYREHQQAISSDWSMLMWIATGDRVYRKPGWILLPGWCTS